MTKWATESSVDLDQLRQYRDAALTFADLKGPEEDALLSRIKQGRKKIDEAAGSGVDPEAIKRGRLRLAQLEDDLKQLRLSSQMPAEILDAFYSLAESLVKQGMPYGATLAASVGPYVRITVRLEAGDEPPF